MANINKINIDGTEYNIVTSSIPDHSHDYLPLSGGTISGDLTVTNNFSADTIDNETSTGYTNHCIALGKAGRDKVEIYEYGGELNFYQSQSGNNTLILGVSPSAFTYCGSHVIHSGNIGSQSVNYANSAGSVAWSNVSGKPSAFPPDSHGHDYLPLAGGTMSGSIITPKNDNLGILPHTDNYGQIGGEGLKFYRMYASKFYGEDFKPLTGSTSIKVNNMTIAYNSATDTVTFS